MSVNISDIKIVNSNAIINSSSYDIDFTKYDFTLSVSCINEGNDDDPEYYAPPNPYGNLMMGAYTYDENEVVYHTINYKNKYVVIETPWFENSEYDIYIHKKKLIVVINAYQIRNNPEKSKCLETLKCMLDIIRNKTEKHIKAASSTFILGRKTMLIKKGVRDNTVNFLAKTELKNNFKGPISFDLEVGTYGIVIKTVKIKKECLLKHEYKQYISACNDFNFLIGDIWGIIIDYSYTRN